MYIIRIIILFAYIAHSYCIEIENKRIFEDITTANIISQFNEHDIMFHFENCTKNRVDIIIDKANISGSIMLGNYDIRTKKYTNSVIIRPIGYQFLHVILLKNYTRFLEYTNSTRFSFHYRDIILLITNIDANNETIKEYFPVFLNNVHRAGAFFIFNLWNYVIYNVCFYCNDMFEKWQKIIDLSENVIDFDPDVKHLLMNIYDQQFKNFNGHTFPVGYALYKPFFWCNIAEKTNDSLLFHIYGSEGELLVLFHERLNMNLHMIEITEPGNSYPNVIEAVRNGTLSWAVGGITTSIKRFELVEFTDYLNIEPYVVLYSVLDDPWMSWHNVVTPLQRSVWFVLLLSIIFVSGFYFLTIFKTDVDAFLEFKYFLRTCFRFLLEQPMPFITNTIKSQWIPTCLMFSWLIVALIITTAYKSKLTSSLINLRTTEYNHVDQLVKLNYDFYLSNIDSSVLEENLESSEDKSFLKILNRSRNDTDFCPSISKTYRSKNAVIDEETNINYSIQQFCNSNLTFEQHENLRLVKNVLLYGQHAWPMPLNTPYRTVFNSIISRLHAAGIFIKWKSDYALLNQFIPKSNQRRSRKFPSVQNKITAMSLFGPLIIWAAGLICASLTFLIELLIYKRKNYSTYLYYN